MPCCDHRCDEPLGATLGWAFDHLKRQHDERINEALEAAYWAFDACRAGVGRWRHADGTRQPRSERDAFKAAVREFMAAAK